MLCLPLQSYNVLRLAIYFSRLIKRELVSTALKSRYMISIESTWNETTNFKRSCMVVIITGPTAVVHGQSYVCGLVLTSDPVALMAEYLQFCRISHVDVSISWKTIDLYYISGLWSPSLWQIKLLSILICCTSVVYYNWMCIFMPISTYQLDTSPLEVCNRTGVRKWQNKCEVFTTRRCHRQHFNASRPRQDGRHFPDDILKWIFLNENLWISIDISLKFVPRGPINNITALVQIMAWRRPGDKPLSEPMMVNLLMHICVTRPQWVNVLWYFTCACLPFYS